MNSLAPRRTGKTPRIAIIGAGLTGLTAGWRLCADGVEVKVFEASATPGGRTRTIRKDGFVFDVGAITMLPTYAQTLSLAAELGISQHLHKITPVIGIPRDGQIHRIDLARPVRSLLSTTLISTGAKFRLFKLLPPMIRAWKKVSYESLSPLAPWDGETIAEYLRHHVGDDINEFIAGPIIRGNTLNDTDAAPFGELLWMLRQYAAPHLYGFDKGINFLAESLAARLPVHYHHRITSIEKTPEGVEIHGASAGGVFTESFDACVIALPPPDLITLAPDFTSNQRKFLDAIVPLPSVNIHLGLHHKPTTTETFILPPAREHPVLTTIVMDHLKAPGRAPSGKGVVSLFCRDHWSADHFHADDETILREVLAMAAPFIGDVRGDIETYVIERWPYAIIKSSVGLYQRMRDYEADIDPDDPIQIGGDFLSLGMESAVISGTKAAAKVKAHLTEHRGDHCTASKTQHQRS